MSAIKEKAWAAMPSDAMRTSVRAALKLPETHNGLNPAVHRPAAPGVLSEVTRAVEGYLGAGELPPDDIAAPYVDALRRDELDLARTRAINDVAARWAPKRNLTHEDVDRAFDVLRDELARVVDAVETLTPQLEGATQSAEVVEIDKPSVTKAWKSLSALAKEYAEIRAVQADFIRKSGISEAKPDTYARYSQFADAIDVVPELVAARRLPRQGVSTRTDVQEFWQWQREAHRVSPALTESLEAPGKLLLLVQTTTPWVPSIDQLEQAVLSGSQLVGHPGAEDAWSLRKARDTYYENAGVVPIGKVKPAGEEVLARPATAKERRAAQQRELEERMGNTPPRSAYAGLGGRQPL